MPYATPAKLILAPANVSSGGTEITGIEENRISLELSGDLMLTRTGIGALSGFRVRNRSARNPPAILNVPLADHSTTALKMLLSHVTTDGATIAQNIVGGNALLGSFALLVRPYSTSEPYIYGPNWRLLTSPFSLLSSEIDTVVGGVLQLVACLPEGAAAGLRPYMRSSAANIASHYGLGA